MGLVPHDSLVSAASRGDSPMGMLADEVSRFYSNPLGFVHFAYPWAEQGTSLARYAGPDAWQEDFLRDLGRSVRARGFDGLNPVMPIREAVGSGHGVGKTALIAWVTDWILSTRPHCQGTVTANTFTQLDTKTWAGIRRWTNLCITAPWFHVTTSKIYHKAHPESWFVQAQSCKEENSEAFAGQHAADSTSFYIVDEASAVPEGIFEVIEGGLTDGEPMVILTGNPTRSTGKFHRALFGSERGLWGHRVIDARQARMTNKELIRQWIEAYGIMSDFVRVRVLGLPPKASDAQFIDSATVQRAQAAPALALPDDALVAGVDFAWGGEDDNVVRFRRGRDARTVPCIRVRGELTRDPSVMTNRLNDVLTQEWDVGGGRRARVRHLFMDSAGIAGPVAARLRALGHRNITEVNFGADSPDEKHAYMRDWLWGKMKEGLQQGLAIDDRHTPGLTCPHCQLESDLVGPGTVPDPKQRVKLESKERMRERGVDSPDDGDALALTYTFPVLPPEDEADPREAHSRRVWG